ncbi:MAG TPA: diaminopimelate decarboxylase [Chthoniobacteraceae bacterium]
MNPDPALLRSLAEKVGTPFWLYDAASIRRRIADIRFLTDTEGMQARYAMKACPVTKILREMQAAGIWIDAVSGNEALRAMRAGHAAGHEPPAILFTSDVFRDNSLAVVLEHGLLPNVGSPGMLRELEKAGYRGAVSLRVNPGFGHGHVNACDTGGPSSKHGIWFEDLDTAVQAAERAGLRIAMLHAHIGSGAQFHELHENLNRLSAEFAEILPRFPQVQAISLGGGIPHNYREPQVQVPLEPLRALFAGCRAQLSTAAGRPLRLEIEPGRYYVAPGCSLITRVKDVKLTRTNEKGLGATFAMVDAGFVDLIRPAMYGSYHRIEVIGADLENRPVEEIVVAGPLCESGDVFTRDEGELLRPRALPRPEAGDLLRLCDAGAYGYAMSSNYNSVGRAPQLWVEEDGSVEMISRRETLDDLLRAEVSERVL